MRINITIIIFNFLKSWFALAFLRECYRRFCFVRGLRTIAAKVLPIKKSLRSRLVLWYLGSRGLKYYLIRSPFQFAHFCIRLLPKVALRSLLFLQFMLYLLSIIPRAVITLFTYIYNVIIFSFFFVTSQLFLFLDVLQLCLKFFLEPVASILKLMYYKLLSFMTRSNLIVILYFTHSIFFWLLSFLVITATLSLFFYRSDFFMGFSHYDLGLGKLDLITHGLVGHWYKSNWWYFRIWVLYAILYFVFPKLRDPIKENFYFIVFFPIFLYIYDNRGVSSGKYMGFRYLDNFNSIYSVQLLLTFGSVLSNYVFSQYGEGSNSAHPGDSYKTGLSGEPMSRDWFIDEMRGSDYELFVEKPMSNVEASDIRQGLFYKLDFLHTLSLDPTASEAHYSYRQGQVMYLMDTSELDFRAADFVDSVPIKAMYFDEKYYNRMVEDIDDGVFLNKLYIDYEPRFQYEDDSLASTLYRYQNMGSVANEPRYYKSA